MPKYIAADVSPIFATFAPGILSLFQATYIKIISLIVSLLYSHSQTRYELFKSRNPPSIIKTDHYDLNKDLCSTLLILLLFVTPKSRKILFLMKHSIIWDMCRI